jgi:DNA-binding GntR family transcriptional regulator
LERVRCTDAQPVIYSIDVFPAALCPAETEPKAFEGSLIQRMAERCGMEMSYSQATISAVTLDRHTSRRIGVPVSTAWILLEQVNYDRRHRPWLASKDYHRGDLFQFNVLRTRR